MKEEESEKFMQINKPKLVNRNTINI